jgi:hypothetical protein
MKPSSAGLPCDVVKSAEPISSVTATAFADLGVLETFGCIHIPRLLMMIAWQGVLL